MVISSVIFGGLTCAVAALAVLSAIEAIGSHQARKEAAQVSVLLVFIALFFAYLSLVSALYA
jgi:hypothetical protein